MKTAKSGHRAGSARRQRRAVLTGLLLLGAAEAAVCAPQDFNLDQPCAAALPRHEFAATQGRRFDARIQVLNGDGQKIFWAFVSPPAGAASGPRCVEVRPGAEFRCGEVRVALPEGSPKASVPDREVARVSGIPATGGAVSFALIVHADGEDGATCERPYLLNIAAANPDAEPPGVPQALSALVEAPGARVIVVRWLASLDAGGGAVSYRLERCAGQDCSDFHEIRKTTATIVKDRRGILPDTDYSYRVRALDAAGNPSEFSAVASARTDPADDPNHPH